jgi:hypothetical protein
VIHVIGDSHALTYDESKLARPHWMGALTAHNLLYKQDVTNEIIRNPHWKWFSQFGEIDCRVHFFEKHVTTETPLEDLIDTTIDNYMTFVRLMRDFADLSVMAVPPQGPIDNVYKLTYYGVQAVRQNITNLYNTKLKSICVREDIPFINVYPNLADLGIQCLPEFFFEKDLAHIRHNLASRWFDEKVVVSE